MSQPPHPRSGPDFGRRPSAGGFTPQDDYSHPDFPTGPPQHVPPPPAHHQPMPVQPAQRPERRSPAMGIIALFIVAIATVIHIPLVVETAETFHDIDMYDYGDPKYAAANDAMPMLLALQLIPAALGLVGFVLGIIAAATRRGSAAGVIAIIVAVLVPVLLFVGFLVTMQDLI